jgi:hypothetical protein
MESGHDALDCNLAITIRKHVVILVASGDEGFAYCQRTAELTTGKGTLDRDGPPHRYGSASAFSATVVWNQLRLGFFERSDCQWIMSGYVRQARFVDRLKPCFMNPHHAGIEVRAGMIDVIGNAHVPRGSEDGLRESCAYRGCECFVSEPVHTGPSEIEYDHPIARTFQAIVAQIDKSLCWG